jgi:hypothetical protein
VESSAASVLSHWESFYVIVGSSGGALTGLMFVVLTLVADSPLPRTPDSINAFGTPNVIHFVAVLLLSAVLSAPWTSLKDPAHVIALFALGGIVYVLVVLQRMRRQAGDAYKPVLEDWIWHLYLPFLSYVLLFISAMGLAHEQSWALFAIGGVNLLLLCIGIHNAWDTVAYIVEEKRKEK